MRVRYMKESPEILAASAYVEEHPERLKGQWKERLQTDELCLEVGCGLGRFIGEMAGRDARQGWIGLERIGTILAKAVQRMERSEETRELSNLVLLRGEAMNLPEFFEKGELDRIYLNFSDPWPKERHAKRRLTSDRFLPIYKALLKENGILQLKTDNEGLYAFTLERMREARWRVIAQSEDLHHSAYVKDNVMTEYESHFVQLGKNIFFLQAAAPREQ